MTAAVDVNGTPRRFRCPVELGCLGALMIRHEHVELGIGRAVRILYASDLHLGHRWTRPVAGQLVDAAQATGPDAILLGGDLADRAAALDELQACTRMLAGVAPVYAVPGNHDARAGAACVRAAVLAGGGNWLPDRSARTPIRIDAEVDPIPPEGPRILCAHYPHVFPAAARAGYGLTLAGHLHGGQCVLGSRGGRLYPGAWFDRWHGLRFTAGAATLLVSRGAADSLPVRFRCPREVILCSLS